MDKKLPSTGAPLEDEVARITKIIMDQIGQHEVGAALTVICNLAGQLVASLSDGQPSQIQKWTESFAENVRQAAITKILHDDAKTRKETACQQ